MAELDLSGREKRKEGRERGSDHISKAYSLTHSLALPLSGCFTGRQSPTTIPPLCEAPICSGGWNRARVFIHISISKCKCKFEPSMNTIRWAKLTQLIGRRCSSSWSMTIATSTGLLLPLGRYILWLRTAYGWLYTTWSSLASYIWP